MSRWPKFRSPLYDTNLNHHPWLYRSRCQPLTSPHSTQPSRPTNAHKLRQRWVLVTQHFMLWFEDLKRKLIRGAGRLIRPKIVVEFLSNFFRPENAPLNNLTQIAVSLAGFSGQRSRYTHYSLITPPGSFQAYFFPFLQRRYRAELTKKKKIVFFFFF